MNDNKRYYWIKLKTDFFAQNEIDFLLSQKNGCQYVVLYQMLCLQTTNQNGKLGTKLGDSFIPYDIPKIVRDTKYFDEDTVRVALELYKKLNLIFIDSGCFQISDFEGIVGSETWGARRKRQQRENMNLLEISNTNENIDGTKYDKNNGTTGGTSIGTEIVTNKETICGTAIGTNLGQCPIDIEIEKDIDIDSELEKEKYKKKEKNDEEEEGHDEMKNENFENEIEKIKQKIEKVFGYSNESIVEECIDYLQYLSGDLIIYGLSVTAGANNPCWNYAKKVLETYKIRELYTVEALLEYENCKHSQPPKLPKNVPKYKYMFMEDQHDDEDWEALYDN